MIVSALQENLSRALATVTRAVDSRPTLPVLANVRLEATDSRLILTATNLEMSITATIGAKVQTEGAITLPAKMFYELVNNLSHERVDLHLDATRHTVNVRCGATQANVKGIAATEFPLVPESDTPTLTLPGAVLKQMIHETVFAAAKEDNRPILTGLCTVIDGDVLTMAAADGYRLAVRTARLDGVDLPRTELVIPARALAEVARCIGDTEDVGITLPADRDVVLFHLGHITISSQLLEGRFPDFTNIIPKSYSTAATVYTTDLLRACKRAEIFARDSANSARVCVKPANGRGEPGEFVISGKSAERGDNEGMLDASVEGEPLEASFNIRYLIDALTAMSDDRVVLESNGPAHPGVLRPDGREDFIVVTMPMSVTR